MRLRYKEILFFCSCAFLLLFISACSSTYYGAMEKVGVHKRDILVDRVADGRDSQTAAQKQFKSALEQFDSVVKLEETDLKKAMTNSIKSMKRVKRLQMTFPHV